MNINPKLNKRIQDLISNNNININIADLLVNAFNYTDIFDVNEIKIDKSFIDKMNSSDSSKQYVASIISIGHIMNFSVISEGVEEDTQLDTLRAIGCDLIQGFIWGHPMTPEEAEKLVHQMLIS